jgi:hypothetical protein
MKLSLIFGGLAALAAATANGVSENKALGGIVPRGVEGTLMSSSHSHIHSDEVHLQLRASR